MNKRPEGKGAQIGTFVTKGVGTMMDEPRMGRFVCVSRWSGFDLARESTRGCAASRDGWKRAKRGKNAGVPVRTANTVAVRGYMGAWRAICLILAWSSR